MIERLRAAGLKFSSTQDTSNVSDALAGMSIVISGNFSISRDAMKELITLHGGKNTSSVSAKTTYLLAGSKPGPEKIRKAEQLGVQIIDEAAFRAMLPEGTASAAPTLLDDEPTLF